MSRRHPPAPTTPKPQMPVALTVAGSDSGGGAGIQADLKTFSSLRVHGTSVITCLTAQNPLRVEAVQAVTPAFVRRQLDSVFSELPPLAAKTGMLFSEPIIRTVAEFFRSRPEILLVVDPVMVATSGAQLLQRKAQRSLCNLLLPQATLVTPNLHEAEVLTDRTLRSLADSRAAARQLHERYGCPALVKGGHLASHTQAIDVFYDGKEELELSSPLIQAANLHGAGCTLSAAITAYLALGNPLWQAVRKAKRYITQAILLRHFAGRHPLLHHRWMNR